MRHLGTYPCQCLAPDPIADPCGHGDTSEGCPRHDQTVTGDDARYEYDQERREAIAEGFIRQTTGGAP